MLYNAECSYTVFKSEHGVLWNLEADPKFLCHGELV